MFDPTGWEYWMALKKSQAKAISLQSPQTSHQHLKCHESPGDPWWGSARLHSAQRPPQYPQHGDRHFPLICTFVELAPAAKTHGLLWNAWQWCKESAQLSISDKTRPWEPLHPPDWASSPSSAVVQRCQAPALPVPGHRPPRTAPALPTDLPGVTGSALHPALPSRLDPGPNC